MHSIPVTDPFVDAPDGAVLTFPNGATYERIGSSWEALWECSGIAARWCAIHGDCTCERDDLGLGPMDDPTCPLHASTSRHGESERAVSRQPSDDVPERLGPERSAS